jgi:uncharacterized membrane protein YeiH
MTVLNGLTGGVTLPDVVKAEPSVLVADTYYGDFAVITLTVMTIVYPKLKMSQNQSTPLALLILLKEHGQSGSLQLLQMMG